ncbi:TPA: membrane-targeted effector domain-containing toxin [Legionella pneumophila]|jgi:hypothetical protein|uniref:Haem-binding uptake Tiki superfamily ChaN domain-containing protein n=1 Tax=Legionella waltersii TaxID=66969 RepID=A0A0W1AGE0_9GAMM|nr:MULTISPECIES: membrane-targeted effector domain-containing toxin [Legionella]KTD80406.1 hypothetical protein Lwal_1103 [Legionella waltersii]SNV10152.1 C-terminal region of Pasteurella multocida toxin residues 569-1285 [Legionella waltersii]HAT1919920.1 hypothetical protein [Legionella pneumophila]HAT4453454.1 hypothetical protein [Legionella pneumophila]HAT6367280.1 hypothetical protein [Legionella pneumophila]
MNNKETISDELRKKFCENIVPVLSVIHEVNGRTIRDCCLDTEKFEDRIKSYFSSISPVMIDKTVERVQDLFEGSFIIGESHSHISPKRVLIENMKKMKEYGYEILFMEHLFYDTDQSDLDKFFETGEISTYLMSRLYEMNRSGMRHSFGPASGITSPLWQQNDYTSVLRAAREAGIRVVGIDISTVYYSQKIGIDDQHLDNTRVRYMNYTAAQIMERESHSLSKGKKWCCLMGNVHVRTFENTLGVSELLGVRNVYIFDLPDWKNSTKPLKGEIELESEFIHSNGQQIFIGDVIYQTDPRFKTSLFDAQLEHPSSVYKEKLANMSQEKLQLTEKDVELAIRYLANLDIIELGKIFGLNEKELDKSYHFVEKITPVNPKKKIEQNTSFSILLESNYSTQKSYILYVSKDQLLQFSSMQKEIKLKMN